MSLTFYYGSGSPFAWKVWLALEHKGIAYEAKRVSFDAGDQRTPEFTALNPHQKIPVIVHDDFALYESGAIIDYLEETFGGPRLWPDDVRSRALARRVAAETESYVFPPVNRITQAIFTARGAAPDPAFIEKGKAHLAPALTPSIAGPFVMGATPTAADYALYPLLALLLRLDTRLPEIGLRALIPAPMSAWMKQVEALPFFARTYPPHWNT